MRWMKTIVFLLIAAVLWSSVAIASDAELESITITGEDLSRLETLAEYQNLRSLTLEDCPAFDLSVLASCAELTTLTISWSGDYTGGAAYDLSPLQKCARLTTLSLIGPGIDDLSALTNIPKLTVLAVENTSVTDFTPIEKLNLKHLRIFGADAESLTTVFTAIGRKLESASVGDCTLTTEANDVILSGTRLISLSFTNAEGIDGHSARWAKLTKLTSLSISGGSVSGLDFCDSYVSTVAVKMTDAFVGGGVCSVDFDKYFLITSDVPSDEMLKLVNGSGRKWQYATVKNEQQQVSAGVIQAFAGITSLLSLDIQAVAADAFAPDVWGGFPKLEQLKVSGCETVSLTMLSQLPGLLRLSVQKAAVSGTEGISSLRKLQQLSLLDCTVEDWAFLDAFSSKLTLLNLSGCNGLATITFVKNLEKLKVLALDYTSVTDLEPLSESSVKSLYLYGCDIADYTPLQALGSLTLLYCNVEAALPALTCRVVHDCVTLVK